jgi:hypothetical protein
MCPENPFELAGFEPGPCAPEADELSNAPRRLSETILLRSLGRANPTITSYDIFTFCNMEVCTMEICNMEVGNMEVGNMEVGNIEVGNMEVGNMEVCTMEVCNLSLSNLEVGETTYSRKYWRFT